MEYMGAERINIGAKQLSAMPQLPPPKAQTDGPEKPSSGILGLIMSTRSQRKAGRSAKRWEDDLNEFVKDEENQTTQSNDLKKTTIHGLLLQNRSMNGKREKNVIYD